MKRSLVPVSVVLTLLLLTGCVGFSVGGGTKNQTQKATVGQQLVDLQKARDSGAITEAEYQAQKAKVLQTN